MKTVLLASVAALALCVAGAAQAAPGMNAGGARGTAHPVVHHAPPKGAKTLYDQNSSSGSEGWFSQTLSSYPQYDEYLADDFTVPKGHTWKVSEVDTTGFYYNGPGPASSVNVLFWNNAGTLPDGTKAKVECDNLTAGNLSTGAFEITLPKSCKVSLKGGKKGTTYWVTVQANLAGFDTSGYWAWAQDPTVHGNQAAGYWYGGSVSTDNPDCNTSFQTIDECFGSTVDLSFALLGKDKK